MDYPDYDKNFRIWEIFVTRACPMDCTTNGYGLKLGDLHGPYSNHRFLNICFGCVTILDLLFPQKFTSPTQRYRPLSSDLSSVRKYLVKLNPPILPSAANMNWAKTTDKASPQ